jgi:hypothetical protein
VSMINRNSTESESERVGPTFGPTSLLDLSNQTSELERSSRLGLTCMNVGWAEGCPQVKRVPPTVVLAG